MIVALPETENLMVWKCLMKSILFWRVILFSCVAMVNAAHGWRPEIGEFPKGMKDIEYIDGAPFDFVKFVGSPLVLYFGGDWCPPCIERGRPAILAVANKYKNQGLEVVMVQMDDNRLRQRKLEEYAKSDVRILMPRVEVCPPGKCPEGLRDLGDFGYIYRIPAAVVIDRSGVVRAKIESGQGIERGLEMEVLKVMR